MGQNSITMFSSDSSSAAGPAAFTQDVFSDVSDTPTNNTGFSSTLSNNPLNNLYANDDFPRFGPKTLWIKDLVLEPNKAFWINGEPTYRIVWSEPFPSAQGYVFGNVQIIRGSHQTLVKLRSQGDGIGVGGVFARTMFLMAGNSAAAGSATATVAVDGVTNTTSVDFSNIASGAAGTTTQNPGNTPWYAAFVHAGANETYQIHDFRLTANQAGGVFQVAGIIVYSENSTLSIDQFPGLTYNNKAVAKTTTNTTLPIPSFGTSIGGRATIWKNVSTGYSMSTLGASTITSIAQGTALTNILNLTTGSGQNFSVGQGIVTASSSGASAYVGIIQSISTDALTVYPTLPFGISNTIYTYFSAGQSLAINASLMINSLTYLPTDISTNPYLDPLNNFAVWGQNLGMSCIDGIWNSVCFSSAAGFIQCEGYFQGAEIEWVGMSFAVLSGTMCINGLPAYNHNNIGFTGALKKTVFRDAGPGWNSFAFFPGSSFVNVGISKIDLYTRRHDLSPTFGILAAFDTLQSFVPRANNATTLAPGIYRRIYADQLLFKGPWVRSTGATMPGGVAYTGSTTTCTLGFQYYGNQFSIVGGASLGAGGSMNISIDSGVNLGATCLNTVVAAASPSLTFHSVSLAVLGGTCLIGAVDFFRAYGEMKNIQTFSPNPLLQVAPQIPIISEWMPYTPVMPTGTFTSINGWWRRVGDTMEVNIKCGPCTNNGSATVSGIYTWTLPPNYSVDLSGTKGSGTLPSIAGGDGGAFTLGDPIGYGTVRQEASAGYFDGTSGSAAPDPRVYVATPTTVALIAGSASAQSRGFAIGPSFNITGNLGNNGYIAMRFSVPIAQWKALQ